MSLGTSIVRQLRAQEEERRQYTFGFLPRREGPYALTVDDGSASVDVLANEAGKNRVALISLRITGRSEGDGLKMSDVVGRIVSEVTCPYGAVDNVEMDVLWAQALLRSSPTPDADYYEVFVDGSSEITVRHFSVDAETGQRTQTPAVLETEAFVELTDGLAGALFFESVPM